MRRTALGMSLLLALTTAGAPAWSNHGTGATPAPRTAGSTTLTSAVHTASASNTRSSGWLQSRRDRRAARRTPRTGRRRVGGLRALVLSAAILAGGGTVTGCSSGVPSYDESPLGTSQAAVERAITDHDAQALAQIQSDAAGKSSAVKLQVNQALRDDQSKITIAGFSKPVKVSQARQIAEGYDVIVAEAEVGEQLVETAKNTAITDLAEGTTPQYWQDRLGPLVRSAEAATTLNTLNEGELFITLQALGADISADDNTLAALDKQIGEYKDSLPNFRAGDQKHDIEDAEGIAGQFRTRVITPKRTQLSTLSAAQRGRVLRVIKAGTDARGSEIRAADAHLDRLSDLLGSSLNPAISTSNQVENDLRAALEANSDARHYRFQASQHTHDYVRTDHVVVGHHQECSGYGAADECTMVTDYEDRRVYEDNSGYYLARARSADREAESRAHAADSGMGRLSSQISALRGNSVMRDEGLTSLSSPGGVDTGFFGTSDGALQSALSRNAQTRGGLMSARGTVQQRISSETSKINRAIDAELVTQVDNYRASIVASHHMGGAL